MHDRKQLEIQQLSDKEDVLLAALQELRQDRAALQQACEEQTPAAIEGTFF